MLRRSWRLTSGSWSTGLASDVQDGPQCRPARRPCAEMTIRSFFHTRLDALGSELNQAIAFKIGSGFHDDPRRRGWLTCSGFRTINGLLWVGSCPRTNPGHGAWTTAASCPAFCTCCAPAHAGGTCRRSMDRPPRSIIGLTDGHGAASGALCWPPWPRRAGSPRRQPSTAPTSRRTAALTGEKGGKKPGHRPVTGRADHQGPRPLRHTRPPCRRPSHPGQLERRKDSARCVGGRPGPHPAPSGRQGL